jgi:hypothetical protein
MVQAILDGRQPEWGTLLAPLEPFPVYWTGQRHITINAHYKLERIFEW